MFEQVWQEVSIEAEWKLASTTQPCSFGSNAASSPNRVCRVQHMPPMLDVVGYVPQPHGVFVKQPSCSPARHVH